MIDFNGFDKGVIGRKLPSDTTLNNMRKSDLIELLHAAEHNHKVLAETYKIATDTSKCNICPLSIDTRRAKQIRADAIEEFKQRLLELCSCYDLEEIDCTRGTCEKCMDNAVDYSSIVDLAEELKGRI